MVHAGSYRDRVIFEVENRVADGGGGYTSSWATALTVWGRFMPRRGTEVLAAGAPHSEVTGILRVRSSSESEAITTSHRVQINSVLYQIRAITNPDRRDRVLEMMVEKGVGQ